MALKRSMISSLDKTTGKNLLFLGLEICSASNSDKVDFNQVDVTDFSSYLLFRFSVSANVFRRWSTFPTETQFA